MFNLKSDQITQLLVIVGVTILLLLLIKTYYYDSAPQMQTQAPTHEPFYNYDRPSPVEEEREYFTDAPTQQPRQQEQVGAPQSGPQASESLGMPEMGRPLNETGDVSNLGQFLPSECYPKDVLSSTDLLPGSATSTWAQVVPAGQGALTDQNFLTAGHHIGMNTVGNSLRNASHDLRSEIPCPQAQVSPWNQTTIGPDLMRRPLDGC